MKFTLAVLCAAVVARLGDAVVIKVKGHSDVQSSTQHKADGHKSAEPWEGWGGKTANPDLPNKLGVKGQPLKPVGIGAYQDAKAVEQRTQDARKACEESVIYKTSKWEDCFRSGGDYLDGPIFAKGYGAHGKLHSAASGRFLNAVVVTVMTLAFMMTLVH
eukprot:TRINITY_DN2224_c0_g1_i2.p2 TRINITY_DN2224_c0_g1~~TRINITY_DN2224_c0_g1_i2.p2  ORF type:complete len:160 (-),score=49.99 TRINITY_DN2224_c0_g1_i2:145-624(-)